MPKYEENKPTLPTWAQVQADDSLGSQVVENLNQRVLESYQRLTRWDIISRHYDNTFLYLEGRRNGGRNFKYRMNLIQSVCIANASVQVGDGPTTKISARESGDKPVCYVKPLDGPPLPGAEQIYGALRPETYDEKNEHFPQPLNDAESKLVKQLVAQSQAMVQQAKLQGLPEPVDALPEDLYVEVDDAMVAKAIDTLLTIVTEQSGYLQAIIENQLYAGIFGFQFMLIEFDREKRRFIYSNPMFPTVHIDPNKTDISTAQWVIYDQYIDADEACALYPDIEEDIQDKATVGPPTLPGVFTYERPMPWLETLVGRKVVIIRTAWIRNQPFPMDEQEAVDGGHVRVQNDDASEGIEEGESGKVYGENVPPNVQSGQEGAGGNVQGSQKSGGAGVQSAPGGMNEQLQQVGMAGGGDSVDASPVYLHGDTGDVITRDHPKWPKKRAIREIRTIGSTLVYDRECKRQNIPMGHNVNVPIPFTPYGQGEPERLEPLQKAYNSSLSSILEHRDAVTYAPKIAARELLNNNPEIARIGFNDPRKILPVDGRLLALGVDKVITSVQPPAMPADAWKTEDMIFNRFQYESDQSAVTRGDLPDSGMSGVAIGQLQNAAKTVITFKGMRLANMMESNARIMIGDLMECLTPKQCSQIVRQFPEEVWEEIFRRHANMDYDVEISTGGNSAHESQMIVNAANTPKGQAAISNETFLSAIGLDPKTEKANNMQQQAMEQQQAQPQPMQGQAQAAPNGGGNGY